jgi:hypothetical protein
MTNPSEVLGYLADQRVIEVPDTIEEMDAVCQTHRAPVESCDRPATRAVRVGTCLHGKWTRFLCEEHYKDATIPENMWCGYCGFPLRIVWESGL